MTRRFKQIVMGWALFVLLNSVYLLTYRGLFQSVDELALFSVTESLFQTRSFQTPQLSFARYHNAVGRMEPLQPLLAVPLYGIAVQSTRLGNIQTVMMFNVLVTSTTAVMLYALLLRLGYTVPQSVSGAIVYGLATMAWPYSKSFFREPLIALLFVSAMLGWVLWRQTRRWGAAAATILLLAAASAGKVTSALIWPAFGLAFVFEPNLSGWSRIRRVLGVAGLFVVGSGLVIAFSAMRAKTAWRPSILLAAWATPAEAFPRAFGLLFGSGRGMFVFSPVLLLAVPGLVRLWSAHRAEAVLVLGALVSFVIGYSSYGAWHGGLVWGSRFLLPVIPLLVIPVMAWLSFQNGPWRMASGALIVASTVFQIAASTVDYSIQITADHWDLLTKYGQSPMIQQLALFDPINFDLLWWHGPLKPHLDRVYVNGWIAIAPMLALLGAMALASALVRSGQTGGLGRRRGILLFGGGLGLLLVLSIAVLLLQAPVAMAGYAGVDPEQLTKVAQIVNQDRGEPHAVVTISNDFHLNILSNGFAGRFVHYWLSPHQMDGFEQILRPPFPVTRYRLVVDRVHMPTELSGQEIEMWLNARLHRFAADWVGGGYQVFGYLAPRADMVMQSISYRSESGIALLAYGMVPRSVHAGEPIWLTFECAGVQEQAEDYDIFLQLLAPDGHFVNGTDGAPQFGAMPTSLWKPGVTVADRRAVFVPQDAAAGEYRLIAGFYRDGERQMMYDDRGTPIGTHVELGEIVVVE